MARKHIAMSGKPYPRGGRWRSSRRWTRHWRNRPRWHWLNQRPSQSGSASDPMVAWAQSCLAQLFGAGVPQDGVMGPETQQAIQQFQMQQQMPPTGMLDDNSVVALQTACNAQQRAPQFGLTGVVAPPTAVPAVAVAPPSPVVPTPAVPPPTPAVSPPAHHLHSHRSPSGDVPQSEEEFAIMDGARKQLQAGRWVRGYNRIIVLGT